MPPMRGAFPTIAHGIFNDEITLHAFEIPCLQDARALKWPTYATVTCRGNATFAGAAAQLSGVRRGAPDAPGRPRSFIKRSPDVLPLSSSIAISSCDGLQMSESNTDTVEARIAGVVRRLLAEHSIDHVPGPEQDLRLAGLTSLDMVGLVLSVEEELNVLVPENGITPSNFRSIGSIARLVSSLRKGS